MLQLGVLNVDVKIYPVDSNESYSPVVFDHVISWCIDIFQL